MTDQQSVGEINKRVQPLPNRRSQIIEPKIVACGRHQKQNYQRDQTQNLKRKIRNAREARIADQNTDKRINASDVELWRSKYRGKLHGYRFVVAY